MALSKKNKMWLWGICIGSVVLFSVYKVLQLLTGLTIGGSFGVGLGGMSGEQKVEVPRMVKTDAPPQVIYRIDQHRFLTLENYISCDKGGQAYYNDTNKGIKTYLGEEPGNEEWRYNRGNDLLAYQGEITNAATSGELAFGVADSRSRCGSGNSSGACPVSFIYSSDYGKTFEIITQRSPMTSNGNYSHLYSFTMLNHEYYLKDSDEYEEKAVVRVRIENGNFISSRVEREREYIRRYKEELTKRGFYWGEDKGIDYYPSEYRRTDEYKKNKTYRELVNDDVVFGDASLAAQAAMRKNIISMPELKGEFGNNKYHCDSMITAKKVVYFNSSDNQG
ncbi:hypothetical protein [Pantoea sp. SO10]|uniref:T6SS immunity protein Tli3 family protein n=1 Tax=Pantoea sp. SO10 TaxID=2575375 RepID=UPI0010C9A486|nr:hypothetical protein [Pantoea sp. SO10]QCP59979.1 hypothetical protein FCN45_11555 [Pantoea sp. SO10]